jgi:hypothetical protein
VKVLKGVNYLLPIQIDGDVEEMYLLIKLSNLDIKKEYT